MNSNFDMNCISGWYRRMLDFKRSFYGVYKLVSSTCVNAKDFKNLYPLYTFDLTRQGETMGNSTVSDITVDMTFGGGIPVHTNAFAVIVSDRKAKFQADGKRSAVVF